MSKDMQNLYKTYYTLVLPPVKDAPAHYSADHEVKVGSFNSEKEAHDFMKESKLDSYPYEVRFITIP